MLKTVIFDLDGTLLNSLQDLYLSTNRMLKHFALPQVSPEEVRSFVGNGVYLLAKRAIGRHPADIDKCFAFLKEDYAKHELDNTVPYDGIISMLETLNKNGIKCGVVSNKLDPVVKSLCTHFFGALVSYAAGESENIPKKPSPEMLFNAMKMLGADAQSTVYVGDSDVDIITAKNANIKCISVLWGFRSKDFLASHGATHYAQTPKDLEKMLLNML